MKANLTWAPVFEELFSRGDRVLWYQVDDPDLQRSGTITRADRRSPHWYYVRWDGNKRAESVYAGCLLYLLDSGDLYTIH